MTTKSTPPSLWHIILRCRCPACGKGKLLKSLLNTADACTECQLDFSKHDAADGPIYIAVFVGSITAMLFTFFLERGESLPSIWVYLIGVLPFTALVSLISLIYSKPFFVAMQYRMRRGEFTSDNND